MQTSQAKQGNTVEIRYTGRLPDGHVFDSTDQKGPLRFVVGRHEVIPQVDRAVEGMQVGEKKRVEVSKQEAYGEHRPDLVLTLDADQIPEDIEAHQGQQLTLTDEEGQVWRAFVTGRTPNQVTLDANHPLAGKDLVFDLELSAIVS
jgi:FKBP-type peptidyl-prolyl cis-trans isomerase 2